MCCTTVRTPPGYMTITVQAVLTEEEGRAEMAASNPTGKAILRASLGLFRQDRQMIWLPVMATITAVVAFAIIAGPVALALGRNGIALLVALACGSVVATAATVIFNVALVFAATDRIEGRTPTIGGSLA